MADTDTFIATAARITGRVQGVWFRGWVRDEARRLGLTGSVRNQPDGSVVALLVGKGPAVAAMLALCREGPELAQVDAVETTPVAPVPELAEFCIEW